VTWIEHLAKALPCTATIMLVELCMAGGVGRNVSQDFQVSCQAV